MNGSEGGSSLIQRQVVYVKGSRHKGIGEGCEKQRLSAEKNTIDVEIRQLLNQGGFHQSAGVYISGREDNTFS